ncbi:hypothetical protein ES703_18941 [subsurface metagenome]
MLHNDQPALRSELIGIHQNLITPLGMIAHQMPLFVGQLPGLVDQFVWYIALSQVVQEEPGAYLPHVMVIAALEHRL